jgi:hypothetical protein
MKKKTLERNQKDHARRQRQRCSPVPIRGPSSGFSAILELKNKRKKKTKKQKTKNKQTNKQTNLAHQEEDCDCSLSFYCWTITSPIIDNREKCIRKL